VKLNQFNSLITHECVRRSRNMSRGANLRVFCYNSDRRDSYIVIVDSRRVITVQFIHNTRVSRCETRYNIMIYKCENISSIANIITRSENDTAMQCNDLGIIAEVRVILELTTPPFELLQTVLFSKTNRNQLI